MIINFRKTIAAVILVFPIISYASLSCGAGVIIGLADHYHGEQKTAILLRPTEPDTPTSQIFNWRSDVNTQAGDRRFGTITGDLRAAFFNKIHVRTFSSSDRCDDIDEVRMSEISRGLTTVIWTAITD